MEHERIWIFNRMQIDLACHPFRCVCLCMDVVCLCVLISSSAFKDLHQRISLHGFICFCCVLLMTFVIAPASNLFLVSSFSRPLFASSSFSSAWSSSSFSFFRMVRNNGMVWPVICFISLWISSSTPQQPLTQMGKSGGRAFFSPHWCPLFFISFDLIEAKPGLI